MNHFILGNDQTYLYKQYKKLDIVHLGGFFSPIDCEDLCFMINWFSVTFLVLLKKCKRLTEKRTLKKY